MVPASSLFFTVHVCAFGISGAHRSRGKAGLEIGGTASGLAGKGIEKEHGIIAFGSILMGEKQEMIRPFSFRYLVILFCSSVIASLSLAQNNPAAKPRARDLGVPFDGTPGPL